MRTRIIAKGLTAAVLTSTFLPAAAVASEKSAKNAAIAATVVSAYLLSQKKTRTEGLIGAAASAYLWKKASDARKAERQREAQRRYYQTQAYRDRLYRENLARQEAARRAAAYRYPSQRYAPSYRNTRPAYAYASNRYGDDDDRYQGKGKKGKAPKGNAYGYWKNKKNK